MDQKGKANFLEDKIEEIEARQHILFRGLNSGVTNKAKHVISDTLQLWLSGRAGSSTNRRIGGSIPQKYT